MTDVEVDLRVCSKRNSLEVVAAENGVSRDCGLSSLISELS